MVRATPKPPPKGFFQTSFIKRNKGKIKAALQPQSAINSFTLETVQLRLLFMLAVAIRGQEKCDICHTFVSVLQNFYIMGPFPRGPDHSITTHMVASLLSRTGTKDEKYMIKTSKSMIFCIDGSPCLISPLCEHELW